MLDDKVMRKRMANGWKGGRPFTVCGGGSLPSSCRNLPTWLPMVVEKYAIDTLVDAGAGDLKYLENVTLDVTYMPFDLFPRLEGIQEIDITTEKLPDCDAIISRMVLNHLVDADPETPTDERDEERIVMALDLFKESATYLIATQFDGADLPMRSSQFCRLDLTRYLGPYLEATQDGPEAYGKLAIWRL